MTAAQKSSKAELVSIYRLEFYKKQKNWKYYSQERKREEEKKKAAKNAKSKLNLTYNIDPSPERDTEPAEKKEVVQEETEEVKDDAEVLSDERGDNLNEAFVDTGTDENATPPSQLDPPNGPYSPRWSIQHWAAQCKAYWPEQTYPSDAYPQTFPSNYPHTREGAYTELTREQNPKYADLPPLRTDLPPYGSVMGTAREWEQVGSYEECEQGWPATSQVWINRQDHRWFEGDIPEEVEEAIEAKEADAVDGGEWALLGRAEDWLGATSGRSSPRGCGSLPSVSSESFTRGAALAPHSTEIDLLSEECVRAAHLSAAALSAAVARHADTLRDLLFEVRRRGDQASTSPVEPMYSFDEYPTRDVGPACCPYQPARDVIVTGSFRNKPDLRGHTDTGVGRGRGRRVQLIGIGMGRPYRL